MLTQTLSNALSGLKVNQQALAVISQNVANANNENYSRQQIEQASVNVGGAIGNGVKITEITRVVDEYIEKAVVLRGSDVSKAATVKDAYDQLQLYFGTPGSNNSITSYIDGFFNNLNSLQTNPKNASVKLSAVSSANVLAQEIATLAKNVETMRVQADQGIEASVNNINFQVQQLQGLNAAVLSAAKNNNSPSAFFDQMHAALKSISAEMDINYRFSDEGTVSITTAEGYPLLDSGARYMIKYTPAGSVDDFTGNVPRGPIEIYAVTQDGTVSESPSATLATGGTEGSIINTIKSGKIGAYVELRDEMMPQILDQLDNLAANLRDAMNAVHNMGSSFPPPTKMVGDKLLNPTEPNYWSGSVRIALLDVNGLPVQSPYASDRGHSVGVTPLTLNLEKLQDVGAVGKPTYQTIIDEINQYYGSPQNRASIGPLTNITLAAKSDSLDGNSGTFNFDLDFTNYGGSDASVVVTAVNVNNGGALDVSTTLPTSAFEVGKGTKQRGLDFTLDMSGGLSTNYAVSVTVQVTDSLGNVSTDTITYNISESADDLQNRRYYASSVSGSGDATLETPLTTSGYLSAKLVDENGNEVAKDAATGDYTASGYLQITGVDSIYRVAIDSMDSEDLGDIASNVESTGRGFSHYFGLNNFFLDKTNGETENAAINMGVRADIIKTPSVISMGTLQSTKPLAGTSNYNFELGESSATITKKMAELNLGNTAFEAAGTLSEMNINFSGYAGQILGYVASETAEAKADYAQQEVIYNGFVERDKNIRGVNIDEEMANTVIFQNAYAANARVITVVKDMFESLLSMF